MKLKYKDRIENNSKVLIFSLILVFSFMVVLIPLLSRGTQSTDVIEENTDTLTLSCPDAAIGDEEVSCDISLNSASMSTQGVVIKYNLPEGVEYVEFTTDTFEVYSNDEDGIVLVNVDGVSGLVSVGNLKLKMPTDAESNAIYKIELVESTIGDGDSTVIELDDVYDEIRIKSDINTLDSIALSDGVLNETFDKDVLEYTVTTDLDKITINAVATDGDKATIGGDIDVEKELHYGTNTFNIIVTSESGIEKIYKVSIFRKYKFTTDKYVYNEDDNYIYVATDIDNLLNNISVDSSLTKDIDSDMLVISYGDELILEIDILRIKFNKYMLIGNTLYVDRELTIDEFSSNVESSDGIMFDLNTKGIVKVLYGEDELDSYDIEIYSLSFDDSLTIDEDNLYIKELELGTTVSELLEKITVVGGKISIYGSDDNKKENDNVIATGDKLRVYLGDSLMDEYELSVLGDSDGDGKMNTKDLVRFRKHLVNWENPVTGVEFKLEGVYSFAFDLDKDGKISVRDLVQLRRRLVGLA